MGLDTTHDCWHGAYSAFHRWRVEIAAAAGLNLQAMAGFEGFHSGGVRGTAWELLKPDVLWVLLDHSDCDGKISWKKCEKLAARLEGLLPLLPDEDGGGHIGNWRVKTQQFIDGLRLAQSLKEDVRFY